MLKLAQMKVLKFKSIQYKGCSKFQNLHLRYRANLEIQSSMINHPLNQKDLKKSVRYQNSKFFYTRKEKTVPQVHPPATRGNAARFSSKRSICTGFKKNFIVLYWFTQLAGEIHTQHSTLDHSNIKHTGSKTYSLHCQ